MGIQGEGGWGRQQPPSKATQNSQGHLSSWQSLRKAGKFLSPWMPSVSFGMSVTHISTAEQAEGVLSSETQENGAITAIFHRVWKTRLRERSSCKCGKASAMTPSWRIGNVPIKIPSISWFFTGYWYQWSASGILPCPKQLFCTWFYGKLWNEIFSRFLGGLSVGPKEFKTTLWSFIT